MSSDLRGETELVAGISVSIPLRGFVVFRLNAALLDSTKESVSIPLRGFVVFRQYGSKYPLRPDYSVSIPLRGFVVFRP